MRTSDGVNAPVMVDKKEKIAAIMAIMLAMLGWQTTPSTFPA